MKGKLILILSGVILIMGFGFNASLFASTYTLSWDFELYNNPYAEQIALNIAQAQKSLEEEKEEEEVPFWEEDPLERFKDMLQRQLLYRISRQIVEEAFGEEGELQPGQYIAGDYVIDIFTDGVITVVITDTATGNTTTIEVPYYDYTGVSGEE